jgi:plasmid maintenance system killer protein
MDATMLQSFANKESEEAFHGIYSHAIRKALPRELLKAIERRMDLINCAESLESLCQLPAMRGEAGVRDAHGKYSIPVTENIRIAFRWEKDGPADIEIKF